MATCTPCAPLHCWCAPGHLETGAGVSAQPAARDLCSSAVAFDVIFANERFCPSWDMGDSCVPNGLSAGSSLHSVSSKWRRPWPVPVEHRMDTRDRGPLDARTSRGWKLQDLLRPRWVAPPLQLHNQRFDLERQLIGIPGAVNSSGLSVPKIRASSSITLHIFQSTRHSLEAQIVCKWWKVCFRSRMLPVFRS